MIEKCIATRALLFTIDHMHWTSATSYESPEQALQCWGNRQGVSENLESEPFSANLSDAEYASLHLGSSSYICDEDLSRVQTSSNTEAAHVLSSVSLHAPITERTQNLYSSIKTGQSEDYTHHHLNYVQAPVHTSQIETTHSFASAPEDADPRHPLPLKESLGTSGIIGIVGGSVGIIAVLGFLAFLWFGHGSAPEGAQASQIWRRIAIQGWMVQAITLSAIALRLIVSVQSTVCTSMIAALFLESRSVRRSLVAWFSVMRSINDGPWRLVELMARSKSLTAFWSAEMWLALLMIVVTLGLQFSSTVLLSDLSDLQIIGDTNDTLVHDLIGYPGDILEWYATDSEFKSIPPTYAMFGEAQQAFSADPDLNGLSNTGLIQRALLPISSDSDRNVVRNYDGNAFVLNTQAACMRPNITAQFKTEPISAGMTKSFGWSVEGGLHYNSTFQNARINSESFCGTEGCEGISFNCHVPAVETGWQSSLCIIDGQIAQYQSYHIEDPKWDSSGDPWSRNSSIALILTTNLLGPNKAPDQYYIPVETTYGEWNSLEFFPGQFINITLCFTGFNVERHHVNMTAHGELQDRISPTVPLMPLKLNTSSLEILMSVNKPQDNHEARGIFDMQILGSPNDGPPSSPAHSVISSEKFGNVTLKSFTSTLLEMHLIDQFGIVYDGNVSLLLCQFCYGTTASPMANSLKDLLTNIIERTSRPANAMLTFVTTIWFTIYYTYLDSLSTLQTARITTLTKVRAPGLCSTNSCSGFIAITTLACVHLIYVAIITVLYVRRIRFSHHSNIWHAISQLATNELKETLEISNDMNDEAVAKASGRATMDCSVKLERLGNSGRVEVVRLPGNIGLFEPRKARFQRLKEKFSREK